MAEGTAYGLSDLLLFSPRVYYRLFELQNQALWPVQILTMFLGLAGMWLLMRPVRQGHRLLPAIVAGSGCGSRGPSSGNATPRSTGRLPMSRRCSCCRPSCCPDGRRRRLAQSRAARLGRARGFARPSSSSRSTADRSGAGTVLGRRGAVRYSPRSDRGRHARRGLAADRLRWLFVIPAFWCAVSGRPCGRWSRPMR